MKAKADVMQVAARSPDTWVTTTVGAICDGFDGEVQTGPFGSQLHASDYCDDGVPVVMPQDMRDGKISCVNIARVDKKHLIQLKRHVLRIGDIVYSRRGDVTRFAAITDTEQGWLCGTGSIRIRLNCPEIATGFLRRHLQRASIGDWLKHHAQGVTMPNLNTEILRALPLTYPPMAMQRRIAAILDQAEALRAKRRQAIAQLDELTQAIFLEMFGDAGENPMGWPVQPVSSYVAEFRGGKSIEAESGENTTTQNRVLKISAVTGMKFLPAESKPVPDVYDPPVEHFVRPGDLLFSRANTTELVGAVAYVKEAPPNLLLPDKLWRFVWRNPESVEPLFVWALFHSSALRREIERRATGTSGSMKNISQEKVFGIPTILPPFCLQQEFARRIAAVEKLKSAHRNSLNELDALFASLQHRAFRGEL